MGKKTVKNDEELLTNFGLELADLMEKHEAVIEFWQDHGFVLYIPGVRTESGDGVSLCVAYDTVLTPEDIREWFDG